MSDIIIPSRHLPMLDELVGRASGRHVELTDRVAAAFELVGGVKYLLRSDAPRVPLAFTAPDEHERAAQIGYAVIRMVENR